MSGDSTNVYGKKTRLVEFFASAARTATANSGATAAPEAYDECLVFVDTTAASGTMPTLDMRYQLSDDDGTTWWTRASAAQITTTGQTLLTIPDTIGRFCRLRAEIGGTSPSFTFTARVEFKRNGEG